MSLRQDTDALFRALCSNSKVSYLEAIIACDLLSKLKERPLDRISIFVRDSEARRKTPPPLCIALGYGNLDALKFLCETGKPDFRFPVTAQGLGFHLYYLFAKNGEYHVSNKSTENLIQIFRYLKEHAAKDNPGWSDAHLGNAMLIEVARSADARYLRSSMMAILLLDWATNINATDKDGLTALLFLTLRSADPELIEELKKRGATLSAADELVLKQKAFQDTLCSAIAEGKTEVVSRCITELNDDSTLLSRNQFNQCLKLAAARA